MEGKRIASMERNHRRVELLAPAGDLEKLKIAVDYGADAVYCAGEEFGLRAGAKNFTVEQLAEGVAYAHAMGRKVHLTLNILAHNEDLPLLSDYLKRISHIPLDAFIISDPGVLELVKERAPGTEIHLSTQANTTNHLAAAFWHSQGVRRIVLARELSLAEIRELRDRTPEDLELEAFVHGAMCISYSGRCLLSSFMTGRDANRGECAHPCRWKYALVEEQRPGEYYPVAEDTRGTYVFNSRDLCMIRHIPDLVAAGLSSLKIEGRIKSVFYVATVVRAYRMALDAYLQDPEAYVFSEEWFTELCKVSHREFTTGFYYGKPGSEGQNYETSQYRRDTVFLGVILSYDEKTGMALVEQRNKMQVGDLVECFGPPTGGGKGTFFQQRISRMEDEEGTPLESAPHARQRVRILMEEPVSEKFLLRKQKCVI